VVQNVLLHGHCYQKAQPPAADGFPTGVSATVAMLEAAGYQVQVIDSGCCGMAGAFGYEAEHYALSMQIGELSLLPAVRAAPDEIIIAASGISCQSQIEDGTTRAAKHPVTLI
jgi:Fe-S oxidoreductase